MAMLAEVLLDGPKELLPDGRPLGDQQSPFAATVLPGGTASNDQQHD
jgi:hypothetical protein